MKLTMHLGRRSYDIILKRGVLERAHLLANLNGRTMLVTDAGVPQKLVRALARQCGAPVVHTLPQGPGGKTLAAVAGLHSHLLAEGFGRADLIAALGGGTAGSVAGFAAATYRHGMPLVHFPTTTASQCDFAIGGHCGLDLDGQKNVVGILRQPAKVIIDPNVLDTLQKRHFVSGLAPAVKIALLASADLFETLETADITADIERIIGTALLHKKNLVERDETGEGERQLLHFGRIFGQGIEAAGEEGAFLHGEATALGMLPFIETHTLLRRTKALLRRLGLPTKHPYSPSQLWPYIQNDSSREGSVYTAPRVKVLGEGYLERITAEELQLILAGV